MILGGANLGSADEACSTCREVEKSHRRHPTLKGQRQSEANGATCATVCHLGKVPHRRRPSHRRTLAALSLFLSLSDLVCFILPIPWRKRRCAGAFCHFQPLLGRLGKCIGHRAPFEVDLHELRNKIRLAQQPPTYSPSQQGEGQHLLCMIERPGPPRCSATPA